MTVSSTLPSNLTPANAVAASTAVADPASDQATGFARILRTAANQVAEAHGAKDSAAAEAESAGDLLAANAAMDTLAAAGMIAPWIVPLHATNATASPVAGGVAGADGETGLQSSAMQITPTPDTSGTAGTMPIASARAAPLPAAAIPDNAHLAAAIPDNAIPDNLATLAAPSGTPASTAAVTNLAADGTPEVEYTKLAQATALSTLPDPGRASADAHDAATDKLAMGQDPGLPRNQRIAAPQQVEADPNAAAVPTLPVATSAYAEADRARREASAARVEATPALSPASIGSATPAAMREVPTIVQAVDRIVASAGWQEDIAQKLTQFVSLRATTAEIRLNPADLGPIGVTISYTDDQARVMITAAQPATRDALEQALPQLKEMLAQQGIALGEAEVRDRRESMPQWADAEPRQGYDDRRDDVPGARADSAADSALSRRHSPRLIDTFA